MKLIHIVWPFILAAIVVNLLTGCAGNTTESVDMKDCTIEMVRVTEIQGRGRKAPNYIKLIDETGQYHIVDDSIVVSGTATIKTCKTYIKNTTLYAGEVTLVDEFTFVKR